MADFQCVPVDQARSYNAIIYGECNGMEIDRHRDRFTKLWFWAEETGLHKREFLVDQIRHEGRIVPFAWERPREVTQGIAERIAALAPWAYQVEFGDGLSTLGRRDPADYGYHRYRANLFGGLCQSLLGEEMGRTRFLDAACHCGPLAMEFATRGAQSVLGVDLRPENIAQARFLSETFDVEGVSFEVENVRQLQRFGRFDVTFCGGLLYHVTFPMELIKDLYASCDDFLILDSLAHGEPVSAFHLVCQKDVTYSAEGEFHYEFHPTYRAMIDALHATGAGATIYEIIGSDAAEVAHYDKNTTRSFIAFKRDSRTLARLRASGRLP